MHVHIWWPAPGAILEGCGTFRMWNCAGVNRNNNRVLVCPLWSSCGQCEQMLHAPATMSPPPARWAVSFRTVSQNQTLQPLSYFLLDVCHSRKKIKHAIQSLSPMREEASLVVVGQNERTKAAWHQVGIRSMDTAGFSQL